MLLCRRLAVRGLATTALLLALGAWAAHVRAQEIDPERGLVGEDETESTQAADDERPPGIDDGKSQAGDDEDFDAGDEPAASEAEDDRGGAFLLAGKVGGGLPFNDLGFNVAGAIEIGYLFSRSDPSFGVYLDVSYFVPQAEGEAVDARLTGEDGAYTWHAWQKELTFQPTFVYRLAMLHEIIVPYAGIGPRLYFLETVVDGRAGDESFPVSEEVSMKLGFGVPLGAEFTLGPGAVIGELLFQWGPLPHDITGDTHLASTTLWVGYRALL